MTANKHNIASFADRLVTRAYKWDDLLNELLEETDEPSTYLIRAGRSGAVKIGRAHNVQVRLQELQVSNHEKLYLIREIVGDDERAFHRHFAHLRIRGEWFRFDDEMLTFVSPTGLKVEEYKRLTGWGADMVAGDIFPGASA